MQKSLTLKALAAALLASTGLAHADPVFNRIATFPVSANIPKDMDAKSESSAEIIAASADGMLLVYTDSPLQALGLIDISDPRAPQPGGIIKLDGEPTSVAVNNGKALVAVNTSASYTQPSGLLAVVELASKSIIARCDLGGQPDSIAISPDGSIAAIAIENERDEDLNNGEIPQLPAGNVVIFSLQEGVADCASMITADVSGLA
ncbi:MAG: alkaline phosphatase, partial [Candidatus Competibacteraceae bacterium]|nr:alkaline phosphatase [Candidatus Competibacteraceae bacterium]